MLYEEIYEELSKTQYQAIQLIKERKKTTVMLKHVQGMEDT